MFKRLEAIRNSHHSDNPRIALQFAMCLHKVPIVYELSLIHISEPTRLY